jgi:hypothetical protein
MDKHLHSGLRFELVHEFLVNNGNTVSTSFVEENAKA